MTVLTAPPLDFQINNAYLLDNYLITDKFYFYLNNKIVNIVVLSAQCLYTYIIFYLILSLFKLKIKPL